MFFGTQCSVTSALEVFKEMRYINVCFTYLLTYVTWSFGVAYSRKPAFGNI